MSKEKHVSQHQISNRFFSMMKFVVIKVTFSDKDRNFQTESVLDRMKPERQQMFRVLLPQLLDALEREIFNDNSAIWGPTNTTSNEMF